MNKRSFLQALVGAGGLGLSSLASGKIINQGAAWGNTLSGTTGRALLIQTSPLAGFQYYEGERLWSKMKPGDNLRLCRAPENKYDNQAVEVWWQDKMLGHIPRMANTAVSQMMDRGDMLYGTINTMTESDDSWKEIALDVWRESGD
ncbi:MAG: HIRAN domain-containing protein [Pseudohongiellaceae bacterium]